MRCAADSYSDVVDIFNVTAIRLTTTAPTTAPPTTEALTTTAPTTAPSVTVPSTTAPTSGPPTVTVSGAAVFSCYFPRFWPESSPASVTIVGAGFQASPNSSIAVTVGGCAVITVMSDAELVCITTRTSGTGFSIGYSFLLATQAATNVTFIPPRAVVELANELAIKTPPLGDAWKHSFLPASSDIVFSLNCRLNDGKVIINEVSGKAECSSIDVNDWGRSSLAYKFLYSSLPKFLSLSDSECVFRVSSDATTAKLTIRFLKDPGSQTSSSGDVTAQTLQQMFAYGQFHMSFGRIITSMYTPSLCLRPLPSCSF